MLPILDAFICELYQNNMSDLPNETPLMTMARPALLIRPVHCFCAISTWHECLDVFGRMLAEQANLIANLPSKIGGLINSAAERYRLLISRADNRTILSRQLVGHPASDMSEHFHRIWDLSISTRNGNFSIVDEVIDKSGLVELVLEFERSTKSVFIAIILRLHYVRWYAEHYAFLWENRFDDQPFPFFERLDVEDEVVPMFSFRSFSAPAGHFVKPPSAPRTSHSARRVTVTPQQPMPDSGRGRRFLMEHLTVSTNRQVGQIYFDSVRSCTTLGIPPFDSKGASFEEETDAYAEAYFAHLASTVKDALLREEVGVARKLFTDFAALCHTREDAIVSTILDLKERLIRLAYAKCNREMEEFSKRYRSCKNSPRVERNLFEYDMQAASPRMQLLIARMVEMEEPLIVQKLVSMETVHALAKRCVERRLEFSSGDQFMELAKGVVQKEEELLNLEVCMRVMECVECFSLDQFLMAFAKTQDDMRRLRAAFTRRKQGSGIRRMSTFVKESMKKQTCEPHRESVGVAASASHNMPLKLMLPAPRRGRR
jgi:hypothetical protein